MTTFHFADLAYPDLADGRPTVLLLPLGAIEPHGPHAPLSTDTLISVGICRRAAERAGDVRVLVLPPIAYGITRYAAGFPGAISISEATLRSLVTEICGSLAAQAFPRIVLVNNHLEPEQVRTLRETVRELDGSVRLLDPTSRAVAERLTDEFRASSSHAGRYETSLVLADAPMLVHRDRMRELEARPVDMRAAIAEGKTTFEGMGMERAYCGSPAEATSEEGEETFETLTNMLVDLIREVART